MRPMIRFAGLTFLLLAFAPSARAEITNCTEISSLPYFVLTPGIYCLKTSLAFADSVGTAIQIDASDVVLDLNGHVLDGSDAGPETKAGGVRALNRKNITVRNGTVRGFFIGVGVGYYGQPSQGHIVENLRVDRNTTYGIHARGKGCIVRNNLVVGTGGGTSTYPYGIAVVDPGVHVVGNEVVDTVPAAGGVAYGISAHSYGAVIERNVVRNTTTVGSTESYGIRISLASATVTGNHVASMKYGIYFNTGASGIYMDNTVGGATTPFTGGTAAGATNFSF